VPISSLIEQLKSENKNTVFTREQLSNLLRKFSTDFSISNPYLVFLNPI